MKNFIIIFLLFSGACFAQRDVQKDSTSVYSSLFKADWKDSTKDLAFNYSKRSIYRYSALSIYDDNTKLVRNYIYHDGGYDLRNVVPDFDRRFFYDEVLPVDANFNNPYALSGGLLTGLFSTIFQ